MIIKVAIINERAFAALGGAERSAFELTEALRQGGVDAHLVAATGEPTDSDNIHILFGGNRSKRVSFASFTKAVIEHLKQNHYDIIHSFLPFDFADIYQPRGGTYPEAIIRNAASCQNRFIGCFKVLTACGNVRRTILQKAEKKLCEKENGPIVAALSNYVAEQFKKHYAIFSERIVIIPNGIKIDKRSDKDFKAKPDDRAVSFLFVANNFRLKGLPSLLKAFSFVKEKKPESPIFLFIAGGDNKSKYQKLAQRLGIENQIKFLNYVQDINSILQAVDVAVLPTFYDPSSRFILEAVAAGKPVITTRYNGASELLINARHGIIIDQPGDVESLAGAIIHFTDKDNIRKAAEAIIADNLKEKISIDRVAKQLIGFYEKIIERKKGQ